jgi:A/G-specific adenine glycosylase
VTVNRIDRKNFLQKGRFSPKNEISEAKAYKRGRKALRRGQFSHILLIWDRETNTRDLPWKSEKDPYKVWLSEIILQQTRVDQGLKYYQKFLSRFPTIHELAAADDETVYKLWEGLGYYSRCKNLLVTARTVSRDLDGWFPRDFHQLTKLRGIGPYTAAAIASFAFNQPRAVVDGNVYRVLARIFGEHIPIDSTAGKKFFSSLANDLLDPAMPAAYNQAIMDFGATVCKPVPDCSSCPFRLHCAAYSTDEIDRLPVKEKKLQIKTRLFNYFVLHHDGTIAVKKRTAKDIWQNLYEFPLVESPDLRVNFPSALHALGIQKNEHRYLLHPTQSFRQQLTHQLIHARFFKLHTVTKPKSTQDVQWVKPNALARLAFPKIIREYLEQEGF